MKSIRLVIMVLVFCITAALINSCGDNNNPAKPVITGDTINIKSFDTLLLKSFLPDTLTTDTSIVLTGLNFTKDTILSIMIGDSSVQFVVASDDSVLVQLPVLNEGDYQIKIVSKSGIHTYNDLLIIRLFNVIEFLKNAKSFIFSVNNIPSIESNYSYYRHYPDSASITNFIDTIFSGNYSYNSVYSLKFDSLSIYEFTLTENVTSIEFSQIKFLINKNKIKFDSIQIITKDVLDYSSDTQKSKGYFIKLNSMNFRISDRSIMIDLNGRSIVNNIDSLTYNYNYFYMHGNTTSRNEINNVFKSPSTDSTLITITISR